MAINCDNASNNDTMMETLEALFKEAGIWGSLDHVNVLKFLGVSDRTFPKDEIPSLISPWLENGHVMTFLQNNPGANRVELVRFSHGLDSLYIEKALSSETLLTGWRIYTILTSFMVAEYSRDSRRDRPGTSRGTSTDDVSTTRAVRTRTRAPAASSRCVASCTACQKID